MDFVAVEQASDDILQSLGITKKGDILSLRGYCTRKLKQASDVTQKEAQDETKGKLLTELLNQKKKKTKKVRGDNGANLETKSETGNKKGVKTRRIQMGWLHYDQQQGRYISMRLKRGGGTREVDVPLNADVHQILEIAKDVFFPQGNTTVGSLTDMEICLANFHCEEVPEFNAEEACFTLQQYIDTFKTTRIRLYVQTKRTSIQPTENDSAEDNSILLQPTFSVQNCGENSVPLIGTSTARADLQKQQEEEYIQSLAVDRDNEERKKRQLSDEKERAEQQLRLHRMHSARVEPEPLKTEPKIEVSVRHIHNGVVSRSFHLHSLMSNVYDWVGSLSITPDYFQLCGFDGKCFLPSESVAVADKQMLYMAESENMPNLLEEDPNVNFTGFGNNEDSLNDTTPLDSSTWQPLSPLVFVVI